MQITSITYGNEEQTVLQVETSDQGTMSVPWPCETWHKEPIQEWIDDGNSISAWVDPVDYMQMMRSERDRLLLACDWTQLTDCPLTEQQKTDYATYRQALRDMPQNNTISTKAEYESLVWPVKPTL